MEIITEKSIQNSFDLRFGSQFFAHIPEQPGVYWFRNKKGRVIHIKRAHNLKEKILSYKLVHPVRQSPELQRLLTHVSIVQWSESSDLNASLALENKLKEDFNVQSEATSKTPQNSLYFGFHIQDSQVYFRLATEAQNLQGYHVFGPFKGRIKTQRSLASLLRLMWFADRGLASSLASPLVKLMAPPAFHFKVHSATGTYPEKFMRFINGMSSEWLDEINIEQENLTYSKLNFNLNWCLQDLKTTQIFYHEYLKKAYEFRQSFLLKTDSDPFELWDPLIAMTHQS